MRKALLFSLAAMIGAPALLAQSSGTGAASRPPPPQTQPGQTQATPGQTQTAPSSGKPAAAPGTTVGSTPTTPGGTETGAGVQPGGGVQPGNGAPFPPGTSIQDVPNQSPGTAVATGTGNPLTTPGVGFSESGGGTWGGGRRDRCNGHRRTSVASRGPIARTVPCTFPAAGQEQGLRRTKERPRRGEP
jgi:hypothetical protein